MITPFVPRNFRMMVLAPSGAIIPPAFANASRNPSAHEELFAKMQQMRGRVALRENVIRKSDMGPEARHRMPGDENSWHLLRLGADGGIAGCARILVHPKSATFPTLRLASSAVARHPRWAKRVRRIVESDLSMAQDRGINIIEPGGWVLEEKLRGTSEGISIALSAFAWARLIGGCLAYVTATVKHGSCSMLRRLGAGPLCSDGQEIPRYYDEHFNSEMELLRLQSPATNTRFESRISHLHDILSSAPVLQAGPIPKKHIIRKATRSAGDEQLWRTRSGENRPVEVKPAEA